MNNGQLFLSVKLIKPFDYDTTIVDKLGCYYAVIGRLKSKLEKSHSMNFNNNNEIT